MLRKITLRLDTETIRRLKRLADRWKLTESEVVSLSLERAETKRPARPSDPVGMLHEFHSAGGIDPARASEWIAELHQDRRHWRGTV